jgi:hypothetical protein
MATVGIIHIILTTDMVMAATMIRTGVTVTVAVTHTMATVAIRHTTAVVTRFMTMMAQVTIWHAGEATAPSPGDHIQQMVMAETNQLYQLKAVTPEGPGQHHLQHHLLPHPLKPEQPRQQGDRQLHLRKAPITGLHQFRTAD